ncbi:unnamed protein product, partial [Symbiodinium pilosum]
CVAHGSGSSAERRAGCGDRTISCPSKGTGALGQKSLPAGIAVSAPGCLRPRQGGNPIPPRHLHGSYRRAAFGLGPDLALCPQCDSVLGSLHTADRISVPALCGSEAQVDCSHLDDAFRGNPGAALLGDTDADTLPSE